MSQEDTSRVADEKPTYIYIAGRGHSGSTLLTLLLGRHSQITAVGELANLSLQCYRDHQTRWRGLCSCGERPYDCPVWSAVIEDIRNDHGKDLKDDPFSFRVSDVGLEEEFRSKAKWRSPLSWFRNRVWRAMRKLEYEDIPVASGLARLYTPQKKWIANRTYVGGRIAAQYGSKAVVDASKDYLGMCDLLRYSPFPIRVLFITRDPRGNVWSAAKHTQSAEARAASVPRGCHEWNIVNGRIHRLLKKVDPQYWMHIRYEDLCRDPVEYLRQMTEFVGVATDEDLLDRDDDQHTIAGNKIRLGNKRLVVREDTGWCDNLTMPELKEIEASCSDLASELGYDLSPEALQQSNPDGPDQ